MVFKSVNKNLRFYGSYKLNLERQINDEILLFAQFQVCVLCVWTPLRILITLNVIVKKNRYSILNIEKDIKLKNVHIYSEKY